MIIFLYGSDTYRSHERLKKLKEGFIKKYDPSGSNTTSIDGENLKFEDFVRAIESKSLLSKKRLIIVKDLIFKNKSPKIQNNIVHYLDEHPLSADDILIFIESVTPVKTRGRKKEIRGALSEYLKEKAKPEEFESLLGSDLNKWVLKEIKTRGGTIDNRAAELLISLVGNDLWQLANEIEKLVNYKKNKTITSEDVSLFVKARYDTDIFKLTDALGHKNKKVALKLIEDQIESGANELYLLTMLARQIRILLQVKEVLRQERNYYTVASRLEIHPFVAKKAIEQVVNFSMDDLKRFYAQLLEIDYKIKTSSQDPRTLFDLFILEACQ
jgi:DNA polymerase-3 subunit delta